MTCRTSADSNSSLAEWQCSELRIKRCDRIYMTFGSADKARNIQHHLLRKVAKVFLNLLKDRNEFISLTTV